MRTVVEDYVFSVKSIFPARGIVGKASLVFFYQIPAPSTFRV